MCVKNHDIYFLKRSTSPNDLTQGEKLGTKSQAGFHALDINVRVYENRLLEIVLEHIKDLKQRKNIKNKPDYRNLQETTDYSDNRCHAHSQGQVTAAESLFGTSLLDDLK
ncbi:hypothetical protein JTE90_017713 [Oedothorax gibbosus]|uniref:Uncharacterized protein n=1 Tax=Oedothorax gibbosus TaxID=931172 RepID=A0AAV6U806_9ARAC|nr:hypothetical protein JTE90_017713 [Oedothorax gibbosus]